MTHGGNVALTVQQYLHRKEGESKVCKQWGSDGAYCVAKDWEIAMFKKQSRKHLWVGEQARKLLVVLVETEARGAAPPYATGSLHVSVGMGV